MSAAVFQTMGTSASRSSGAAVLQSRNSKCSINSGIEPPDLKS